MPREMYVTVTRPDFERATAAGSMALQHGIEYCQSRDFIVDDLPGNNAVRTKVLDSLKTYDPIWFFGVGHGNCYSEDTEILTENGWKRFYELEPREKVATLNPETDELEYQTPTAYFKFRYKGKMLYINGKRINLLVTPNHRLYVSWLVNQGKKWRPYTFIEAKDIGKKGFRRDPATGRFISLGTTTGNCLKFKRSAKWNCRAVTKFVLPQTEHVYKVPHGKRIDTYIRTIPVKKVAIEDWIRFFGIWIAEGSASLGDRKGEYIISITQNDDEKRRIIKKWVDKVGEQIGFSAWEEASNSHSKCIKFKNKQVYEYLAQFGHAKDKYIPKEMKMLPPRLLKLLLESMMFGDGDPYNTSSWRLAGDVQEIAMKIGKGATIRKNEKTGVYKISVTDGDACVTKRSIKWIDYDGFVYCVHVPNQIIYVRRNGKACWCGNSDIFTGQNLEHIFWTCNNKELRGRVVYLLSCITGAKLGPDMVNNKGAAAFIGYKEVFSWLQEEFQDPLKDPYGKAFFEPVLEIIYRLADGYTTREAYNASMAKWNSWIDYWTKSDDPYAPMILQLLIHDRDVQILLGSEEARVTRTVPEIPWWLVATLTAPAAYLAVSLLTKPRPKMKEVIY